MGKASLSELKYEDCKAGGKFALARDPKHRGFLYLIKDGERPEKMLNAFNSFKKIVDREKS